MEVILKSGVLNGEVAIPPSKSHSIRALLIAAFARSVSTIENLLLSDDIKNCIEVCKALGTTVAVSGNRTIIDSTHLIKEGEVVLNCGNSGTTLFFATALCCTLNIKALFTGDLSLSGRTAKNLLKSLSDLGAEISENFEVPYFVKGTLKGGRTEIDCPTSQYLSALLLACPLAENDSRIKILSLNEKPYVAMTLSWLKKQDIRYSYNEKEREFLIYGKQSYQGFNAKIPGDYSSAAFFFTAAAITGGKVSVSGLEEDDTQGDRRILDILNKMGCLITSENGQITLRGPEKLKAVKMDLNSVPDLLPVLAVAGCFTDGEVVISNVAQARLKESDRISVMVNNLNSIGADITETDDGMIIRPVKYFSGGRISCFNDHRVAMAMAVSSLKCSSSLIITGAETASVSFPEFFNIFNNLVC